MEIELKLIRTDGGTQPREKLDMFVVDEYAQAMREGAQFPPLTVFYDGQDYWLADGYHRYHAIRQLGLNKANVEVRQGTRREAVLYSCGANTSHGMRRTNFDKRRAVTTLLADSEWQRWSDREIARRCQVANTFVSNLRHQTQVHWEAQEVHTTNLSANNTTQFQPHKQNYPDLMSLSGNLSLQEYESMSTVDIDSYSCNDLVTENIRKVEGKLVDNTEARSGQFNKKAISGEDRFTLTKPIISERLYINRHGTLSTRHVPVQLMPQGILAQPTQITSTLPVASTGIEVSRILLPVPEPNSPDVLDEEITYSQPDEEPNKVEVSSTAPAGLVFGGLSAQLRSRLADTPIREQPDELARLAKLNPTDQTKVVGLLTQSYEAASPKPLTVQKALNQHRHEQAEASRLAVLASLSPKFTHSTLPDETKSSSPKIASGATGNGLVGVDEGESESWTVTAAQEVVECELVLADPPYGILKGVEWEPQEVSQLEEFSREWATRWGEQSGAGVIAIFWSEDYLFEGRRWFDESLPDYEFQQLLIWHYPNTLKPVGRGHFRNSYDPIFIYRRKGSLAPPAATTNWPAGVTQSDCHVGAIPQSNYLEVDRKFHPTQKPLSVALWLLSILSKPGDRIADPFCGSGTFGVAAVQLGRQYHGIELNEEYQKLTRHRILTYGVAEALQKNSQTSSQPRFEAI